MKLFKGKYYKKLYEEEKEEKSKLIKAFKKTNEEYGKQEIKFLQERAKNNQYTNTLEKTIEKYKEKLVKLETKRRESAGKAGGLTAKNNKLSKEKQEMLDLINKLLDEIRRLSKEKPKPTLNELKKYFRINY